MTNQNFPVKDWIYNLDDYRQIFNLTDQEIQKGTLDYPGGVSSVNAELYALGQTIISAGPSYRLSPKEMQGHAKQILQNKITNLRQNVELLSTPNEQTINNVIQRWQLSTEQFLADYELGKKQGRYIVLDPPPFTTIEQTFELLLCTDFLFNKALSPTHSSQQLMDELCKLATEIRVFPLPDAKKIIAAELGPIMLDFQQRNYGIEVRAVNYPLRSDANAFLRIWAKECEVNT